MAGAPAGNASTIAFATNPQLVAGREINVKATFDFDFTAQTVTIYLLNLESNPVDIAQGLGSLRFDLTNAGTTPTLAYRSSSIGLFDIDNQGRPQSITRIDPHSNTWKASNIGGDTMAFCAVCATTATMIPELVLGGPSNAGTYAKKTSLTDGTNDPFLIGSGASYASGVLSGLDTSPSWVFQVPNLTPTVMVSNVLFGFGEGAAYGTASYFMANYTEYEVPEPDSNIMIVSGLGLVALAVGVRRYMRSHG